MNRDEFEPQVLKLWMTSRIPLTQAHIQYYTGARRKPMRKWLDELVLEGVLDMDVGDDGEIVWRVPGADRPVDGPRTFPELEKLESIREEGRRRARRKAGRDSESSGDGDGQLELALTRRAMSLATKASTALDQPKKEGDKSLLLSAGLSLLGPIGWLYAGSLKEAVPAALVQFAIAAIVPSFLLMPVLFVALPLSSIAGLVYAWQYNKSGHRGTLFLDRNKDEE